jgi:hypothetical protein
MARSRKKPFVLALVVSLGCARTGLELAELGAIDEAGGGTVLRRVVADLRATEARASAEQEERTIQAERVEPTV